MSLFADRRGGIARVLVAGHAGAGTTLPAYFAATGFAAGLALAFGCLA
jgi:hypothetical protein